MPPLNTVCANASVQLLPQLDTGGVHAAAARRAVENGLQMGCVKKFAHLHSQREAETMLSMLVALFPDQDQDGEGPGESQFTWIRPDEVPAHLSLSSLSFQESLVHEEHLTKVLQDRLAGTHHSSPVQASLTYYLIAAVAGCKPNFCTLSTPAYQRITILQPVLVRVFL